ncbi:uncharacterized protein LOC129310146 [Prosopis cineraria]|uniref:uncharacterized protein LOC129310146 n=1 Tax=Prosopis cineraria TaxID=364024 RepID=UPI00240F0368|nr:uncharacterized protein LOC129310146 [Prosopis cineraria]
MEGLVSSRTNLVCAYGRKYQSRFLPSSTLQLRKSIYEFRLKTTKWFSSFNVTFASVQPVRGSKIFLSFGETLMLCALMSIVPSAWMKVLMSSLIFAGLERLWQNGLLEQWVVLFLLRMPWLPDYLCSVPLCLKFRLSCAKTPQPVASMLGIHQENIFANQLLFGSSEEFIGFDKNESTSRSGGEATAMQQIRKVHGYKVLSMIGDGTTDSKVGKNFHIFE